MTNIDRLPGVYYTEKVTYELSGVGSKIPIFIGKTGNTTTNNYKVDGTVVLKFTNRNDVFRPVQGTDVTEGGVTKKWQDATGILAPNTSLDDNTANGNLLAHVIKEFYDEARLLQASDIGVPYIYVIDVGAGTDLTAWTNAIATAKAYFDAPVEVYVGLDSYTTTTGTGNDAVTETHIPTLVKSIADSINTATVELNLRYAFFTTGYIPKSDNTNQTVTDKNLGDLSDAIINGYGSVEDKQKLSRVGLIEPLLFGKTVARICCTPYNIEPGYYAYRSVSNGTFIKRAVDGTTNGVSDGALYLQNKGVIFNRDEHINSSIYPKINLCTSLSFNQTDRPADSLFHARFNADDLLRDVFEACYSQVKANESETNLAYLQTRVNKIVNDRVSSEDMIKWNERTEEGTKLTVAQSDADPYSIIVSGQIQPQKCTIAIDVQATVKI